MNDKFFKLPSEKQQRIINAAYKVFSQSGYKKAPMSEIANESGISKALLFHYFVNKKELYLYLWNYAIEITTEAISESYSTVSQTSESKVFDIIDTSIFRSDVDLKMMYSEILYAVEGYMMNKYRSGHIMPDEIEQEIADWIDFWEKIYTKGAN